MKRFLAWACALIVLAAGLCAGALAAREIFAGYALLDAEACLRDPEDHLGEKTFLRGRVEAPLPGDEGTGAIVVLSHGQRAYICGAGEAGLCAGEAVTLFGTFAGVHTYAPFPGIQRDIPAIAFESALQGYYREGTAAPTEAPTPQPISAPSIGAAASGYDEGGVYVFDGGPTFQWSVQGDVARYVAAFYAPDGSLLHSMDVNGTTASASMGNFTPGADYTLEVTAYPADGGEPTSATFTFRVAVPVTEAPTPQPIPAPSIGAAASGHDEGGVYVFDGSAAFQWSVDGNVGGYTVTLYDASGALVNTGNVPGNGIDLSGYNIIPGADYTLEVVAHAADGGADTSATFTFRVAVPVTEAPTPQPIPAPSIGAAASGHEEGGVYVFDGSAAFQWSVDGNVGGYTVTLYDASGALVNTGNVPGNSVDLSGYNIIPGADYTLEVVAHPADGGADTSSTITFRIAGADMPAIIDRNSDPGSIEALQEKLFNLGMFTAGDAPQRGVFDQRTLEIVLGFQQAYNAQNPGAPLVEIDPTDPNTVIDATTLALIGAAPLPPLQISMSGGSYDADGVYMFDGDVRFTWSSVGDAYAYTIAIYDANGDALRTAEVSAGSTALTASGLPFTAGVAYTFAVTAHTLDGGDICASVRFAAGAPAIAPPQISAPTSAYVVGDVYVFDGAPYFWWPQEDGVDGYTATLYDAQGNVLQGGTLTGNSVSLAASYFPDSGEYTLEVIAHAANGGADAASRVAFRVVQLDADTAVVEW